MSNYTSVPNEVLDKLVKLKLTGAEYGVLLVIIRKTYGFKKDEDWISLSQFCELTDNKCRRYVVRVVQQLIKKGLIIAKLNPGKKTAYCLSELLTSDPQITSDLEVTSLGSEKSTSDLEVTRDLQVTSDTERTSKTSDIQVTSTSDLEVHSLVTYRSPTKENIQNKYINNNIINNIITAEAVTEPKKTYGNEDVNVVIDEFKKRLNLKTLDGTIKDNRMYAYQMVRKYGRETTIKVIEAASRDRWWHGRMTSFRKLFYNAVTIMSSATGRAYGANKVVIDPSNI